jgi:sarcosine oxidase
MIEQEMYSPARGDYDVIVLGVGSMGSAACYYLAREGLRVLGIEQYSIPNHLSSHAGQSRIVRKAYFEHPDYVPLLQLAYKGWKELEEATGKQVYYETGLLYAGQAESMLLKGVVRSAAQYNIALHHVAPGQLHNQLPHIQLPANYVAFVEPEAGFVRPELAVQLFAQGALQNGAQLHSKERVLNWSMGSKTVQVTTNKGTYTAAKIIITTGAWTAGLLPALSHILAVTRQTMAWLKAKNPDRFRLGKMPCWMIADTDHAGVLYGFPQLGSLDAADPGGFKMAHHHPGTGATADTVRRMVEPGEDAVLRQVFERYFPHQYAGTLQMKTCMYTNTPDQHFLLGKLPGYGADILLAAGFSGHGFKFVPAVGRIMCDLVTKGKTDIPIGFLQPSRFSA